VTLLQRAREAALLMHDWHMARLDDAPSEWVVRRDAAPYAIFLERTQGMADA
jgi:hypothetical protein